MQAYRGAGNIAGWTAAASTTATFAKSFVPFYLIGSTAVFAIATALAIGLVAWRWQQIYEDARRLPALLVLLALLYGTVVVSYFLNSFPAIPPTYLLGILIFHSLFLAFGFATARAVKILLMILLAAAAVYSIVIVQYVVRFGDLMEHGYFHDIFSIKDPLKFGTFHQNIGTAMAMAALAALGLSRNRTLRLLVVLALPPLLLFLFHIAARGALVALICSLIFLASAAVWARSRRLALLGVAAAIVVATLSSGLFYRYALHASVDAAAPDAISRTIREIQAPHPQFRTQIWSRAWHRLSTGPARNLAFGRGIGVFPVDEGFEAPDWLLRRSEGSRHYPHNTHLEMLYETGIIGLLLFSALTLVPLAASLKRWESLSRSERSAMSLYVFVLVGSGISGAFAFSYDFLFFLGLAAGITAKQENSLVAAGGPGSPERIRL